VSKVDGEDFYQRLKDFSVELVKNAVKAGRMSYTLAIGCTGGMHRSVATVERITADIANTLDTVAEQYHIQKHHRDVDKGHREEKREEKNEDKNPEHSRKKNSKNNSENNYEQ